MHEVVDRHASALEEELDRAPPALLDDGVREAAPVPNCGFIQFHILTSFLDCHDEKLFIRFTGTPPHVANDFSFHSFYTRFLVLIITAVCQVGSFFK